MAGEAKDMMDDILGGADETGAEELELEADSSEAESDADAKAATDSGDQKADDTGTDGDPLVKIEALTREKNGIYREMITERQQRQELQSKVDAILAAMSEAKHAQRQAPAESDSDDDIGSTKAGGIPVKFDADGNPYVDPKDLQGLTKPEVSAIRQDLNQMRAQGIGQAIAQQNQQIISSVLSQGEQYPQAARVLDAAYRYLDAKTGEIMANHGLTIRTTNVEQVMDLLEKEYGNEFAKHFPGIDIDLVVEAMIQSPDGLYNGRKISRALKTIVNTQSLDSSANNSGKEKLNQLKFIASKPSNLSNQRNQKGTAGRTLKDIADIGMDDFLSMSDADIKKIERALGATDA